MPLKVARWSLLVSILLYVTGLAMMAILEMEVGFLVGVFAMITMVVSAIACVTIQVGLLVRHRNK